MIDVDAFNAFESAGWEARAATYGHYWPALTSRLCDPLLDAVSAAAGMRVLDVACGPGDLASRAVDRGATAIGVDISQQMIILARQRFPHIEFRRADAHALPIPDGSFDIVVVNLGVPHWGRPEQAVTEFWRVLRPNGRLGMTTWDVPLHARLVGVLLEAVREGGALPPDTVPAGPDFFRFADDAAFGRLLRDQSFDDVEVTTVQFLHTAGSTGDVWDGLLNGTVRTSAVIRGQRDDVVQRIRAGFDTRMQAYRTGTVYQIPVSFKLATGRRC